MIGVEPNTIYIGRNSSAGSPARILPFKPSPDRTNNGRRLFKALYNTSLVTADQAGTPYQYSFILSEFNSIALVTLYNNTNLSITYDAVLNADGTVSFSVTDINGTSTITTTQALEVGWSYELTFQYTYNGEFMPITYFNRSDFMFIYINGRRAITIINVDGSASVTVTLSVSNITITSTTNTYIAAIAQWYTAWWIFSKSVFAWQWWYYWWYAWWRSYWWSYWFYWWWWYVWWDCVLTGCDPSDCGPNDCHPAAPFDTMYKFDRMVGDIDFVLAGVGIRDFNTNTTPAIINVTVPGPVIKAYLYWNTLGGGSDFCPDTAIFNGSSVDGDIIGCCGNTCWSVYCVNSALDSAPSVPNQNILNKVWFHDVTALVPGSGSYTISIPDVYPGSFIAHNASDSPYYPGCHGGQGIALLVIYQTQPQIITRPRQHCCIPIGNETVTERETREIILWHGAKLLICNGCSPPTIGGSNEYSISWKTKHTWKPKIATAVGDAQSKYKDSFFFNGISLPPQPSYFNPYVGNLMHIKTEYLPNHSVKCDCGGLAQDNTVKIFTPDDCLCWFLFVYSGAIKCVTPIISQSHSFISPPTPMMALWNPNPPDCCPVRLPCCGDICLPARLNVGITASTLACSCLATQGYVMDWNKTEQKYIMQSQTGICSCTLSGALYCTGSQWTLYLALISGSTVCSNGLNNAFPINCSPFGGVGPLLLTTVDSCGCTCTDDILTVSISTG